MAAKKLFTQIFIYFSKPLRLLYSLIIYEIVNFSFFTLYSLLLLSFFLYLKSVPIYVIVHVHVHIHVHAYMLRYTVHVYGYLQMNMYMYMHKCVHAVKRNIPWLLTVMEQSVMAE